MTAALASAAPLPAALNGLPTAAVVSLLCAAVIVEIIATPTVLPGATITLLAGALIGTGRPALVVAIPVAVAVVAGDQLAFFAGTAVSGWWRRRRPARPARAGRGGRLESWLAAALPALAGAAGLSYRQFAPRVLAMRGPWLAGALSAGVFGAQSLAHLGHVIGIAGLVVTALAAGGLLAVRRRHAGRRPSRRTRAVP